MLDHEGIMVKDCSFHFLVNPQDPTHSFISELTWVVPAPDENIISVSTNYEHT